MGTNRYRLSLDLVHDNGTDHKLTVNILNELVSDMISAVKVNIPPEAKFALKVEPLPVRGWHNHKGDSGCEGGTTTCTAQANDGQGDETSNPFTKLPQEE